MKGRRCLVTGSFSTGLMVLTAIPVSIAADMAPGKAPPLMPGKLQTDEGASFELEGVWDRSGFAPRREFGFVRPFNADNDGFDPGRSFMSWDSKGDRGGLEATVRSRPLFHTGDAPTRLFVSGTWIADRANAAGAADLTAAGDTSFVSLPLLGNAGSLSAISLLFDDALPYSAAWTFESRGQTFGGAFGLQWDLRSGRLRVDATAGVRVEWLERREKIGVQVTGFQINLSNPALLDYASTVDLDATFVSATFGSRWAYGLSPALDLIGRFNFDVGHVKATANGRDSFTLADLIIDPAYTNTTTASASVSNTFLRAALAGGFAWMATPNVSLTLLGTANWTSHVPYIRYGELTPTGGGIARTAVMGIGLDDQASYGVRGGLTMKFSP